MKSLHAITATIRTGVALAVVIAMPAAHRAAACVHPTAGLVSWWPGDNSANDAAGDNGGTLEGGASFAPGVVGQAFRFDGVDDYVSVVAAPTLHPPAVTIDLWLQAQDLSNPPGTSASSLVTSNLGDADGYQLQIENDGTVGMVLGGGTHRTYYTSGAATVRAGQWYHLAVSYDGIGGAGSVKLYVNGVAAPFALNPTSNFVEPSGPIYYSSSYQLTIGRRNQPAVGNFNGLIDEIDIYDRALAPHEVQAIYAAGVAGKCRVIPVSIDIKPGSTSNTINPYSKGLVPVAILTTASFDARTVNPDTVRFGPTGSEAAALRADLIDVNGDGLIDMILHVSTQAANIHCGDSAASLIGESVDGHVIQGTDVVNTVACR